MEREKGTHIGYIDFLKGLAIVFVILLHALPRNVLEDTWALLHIWQAVPLFIFVSFMLIYMKLERISIGEYYFNKHNWLKLLKRIIVPFLAFEGVLITMLLIKGDNEHIGQFLQNGRIGRGSYYFYVYLQVWFFAPLTYLILRWNRKWGGVFLLFASLLCNVICHKAVISPMSESCLAVRYIFIAVIAYEWLNNNESVWWKFIFPIISIMYWLLMSKHDFNPWIPNTDGWRGQQFPAYFYLFPFVSILVYLYSKCPKRLSFFIQWLGKYSWEIFLMQMVYFLLPVNSLIPITNYVVHLIIYSVISLALCILPIYVYSKMKFIFSKNEKSLYNSGQGRQ